ncbi:hypothetical protein D3C83_157070 [compost metagenome]
MRPFLNYLTVLNYYYLIKMKKGKDPVGDNDRSPVFKVFVQVSDDLVFGFGIHRTQAVIKDH